MYTAKLVYENTAGKRIGTRQEMYESLDLYQYGIAAVICNLANIATQRGKVRHIPEADLYSLILKCLDPNGDPYFLSLVRDRVTVSSYTMTRSATGSSDGRTGCRHSRESC